MLVLQSRLNLLAVLQQYCNVIRTLLIRFITSISIANNCLCLAWLLVQRVFLALKFACLLVDGNFQIFKVCSKKVCSVFFITVQSHKQGAYKQPKANTRHIPIIYKQIITKEMMVLEQNDCSNSRSIEQLARGQSYMICEQVRQKENNESFS